MLNVKVKFYGVIRDVTKTSATELQMAEGSTIRDLLNALHEKYGPAFADRVLDDKTGVRVYVKLFLNNGEVGTLDAEIVPDGTDANAMIYVMPGSAGG